MKINYDKKIDALNITLRKGKVKETIEVAPEILLDVDKNGNPLYLEILGASEKVGRRNFNSIEIGSKSFPIPTFV